MGTIRGVVKIDHHVVEYEGLNALSAIMMALFESTGLRELVDSRCPQDLTKRILSVGMGVKCMVGPVFWNGAKLPLYLVEKNYRGAPTDLIFGPDVRPSNLNDDALGRCLDSLAKQDLQLLIHESSEICVSRFSFESQVRHDDGTNFKFYGMSKDVPEGEIYPAFAGKPKDNMRDLLHYCFQLCVDSNGIIRDSCGHRGNISDQEADGKTLDFFGKVMELKERRSIVYVADSKVVNAPLLGKIEDLGIRFISRCPVNFGGLLQERALAAASNGSMVQSSEFKDLLTYDVTLDAVGHLRTTEGLVESHPYRLVVTYDKVRDRKYRHIQEDKAGKLRAEIVDETKDLVFGSEKLVDDYVSSLRLGDFVLDYRLEQGEFIGRKVGSSRPLKNPISGFRMTDITVTPDARTLPQRAWEYACGVLITDIPQTEVDQELYRNGLTTDGIIRLYREQYVVEHCIRFTKSGVGIDQVFLQTPSRERAMMFIVSEIALISSIADAVFRREGLTLDGRTMTVNSLIQALQGTTVKLDRNNMRLFIEGPAGVDIDLFEIIDALKINPRLLIGYMS